MLSHHFDKSMWVRVEFGNVVENKNESSKNPASEGLTRVVGLDDMDSESLPLRRWSEIHDLPDGTTFTRKFIAGQVLFGKRRSYQKKVSVPDFDGVCSGDILVFEAKNKRILNNFLPLVVQSADFMRHAIATSAGSLSPRTKWSDLAKYKFCLPSLKDQEKIIEIISSIDKTIEAYQDLPLGSQRESMLHELLSAGGEDWTETTLGDVAEYINGYPFKPSDLGDEGTAVIRIKQLLDPMEKVDRTTVDVPKRCVLSDGDIVFSWSGTLAVRVWNRGPAYLNQHLFRVIEKTGVSHEWLPLVIDHAIEDLVEKSHGTTMKHITKQTLLPHQVSLPPIGEQKRIVEIVSSMDEVIRATKQAIRDLKALRISLLTEILSVNDNG
jgi:type I restriction enzyme S subunit